MATFTISSRLFKFLSVSLLLGLLLEFLLFRDLPMVDIWQHASQLATWQNWSDPNYRPEDVLEVNLRTPYLLSYALAWAIPKSLGATLALKFVAWLSVLGNLLSFAYLTRATGHRRSLSLLAVPTSLGYSFYFGFINFLIATPLVIACWATALVHSREPTKVRGCLLSALLCLTLVSHGVAFALAVVGSGALLLRGEQSWFRRNWVFIVPALVTLLWLPSGSSMARIGNTIWNAGLGRLITLPSALVGFGVRDRTPFIFGLALLALTLLGLGLPSPRPERFAPLTLALVGFCFFPTQLDGYAFISSRFAAFVLPGLLIACQPQAEPKSRAVWLNLQRSLLAAVVFVWFCVFSIRLYRFNRETAPFYELIARLPRAMRVRALIFERSGQAFPGVPVFLHLIAEYQVEKGGRLGHSFTMYPNAVLRLRPGVPSLVPPGSEWYPESFDARFETLGFDYFVVRSERDRTKQLFSKAPVPVVLDAHRGSWWGYRPADEPSLTAHQRIPGCSSCEN